MAAEQNGQPYYYVPEPSYWPITGSVALLTMATGTIGLFNGYGWGKYVLGAGLALLLVMMFGWFGKVIRESESGLYNERVDLSFRWSMGWFIFSEVMFFAAFFGALFWARLYSVPDLASFDHKLLWPDYVGGWPTNGPYLTDKFTPMGAWGIPAINTLLLLTSGVTLTWAHWGLLKNNRAQLKIGLFVTIALGAAFLALQIYEYGHAYSELNLKLTTGVYGATFYMLTGFHGFHVTVGAIMLAVMFGRSLRGHFTPEHHFAFEAAAWYWHFVDVVWLGLFVLVYWLV